MNAAAPEEVLRLTGALDFSTLPGVLAESEKFVARTDLPQHLTIDFADVTGVDSSAVALLLDWRRRAQALGRALAFVNIPPNLLALARLYGVDELIQPQTAASAA